MTGGFAPPYGGAAVNLSNTGTLPALAQVSPMLRVRPSFPAETNFFQKNS